MSASMSPKDYRHHLELIAYSQERFAVLMGASKRTGQKWALGESRIPGSVVLLLRLLEARPELLAVIEGMAPAPTRARGPAKGRKRRIGRATP